MTENPFDKWDGGRSLNSLPTHRRKDALVSLNFKVPFELRHDIKLFAAKHDLTMNAVLIKGVALLAKQLEGNGE